MKTDVGCKVLQQPVLAGLAAREHAQKFLYLCVVQSLLMRQLR